MDLTQQQFEKDVAGHVMQVLRDDGLYRHIRFRRPDSMCMHFDLITWPGTLCYTGDMGTFVFSRLDDMFEFFRTDRRNGDDSKLFINLSYWSEKLRAVDGNRRQATVMEFSEQRYERVLKEKLVYWWRNCCSSAAERRELREALEESLLDKSFFAERPETVADAIRMASEFEADVGGRKFRFEDFWDNRLDDYTHTFIWCCYALAWGIRLYDQATANSPTPEAAH